MKTVLITGVTGAIGSALAPLFLEEPETRLRLVTRARSAHHLAERLRGLCQFWGLDHDSLSHRVEALAGDVSRPYLGLEEPTVRRLSREITHVVHAAGNVRLNQPLADAQRDAVDSARYIVDLVRVCQDQGQFRKLEFVSTIGVAGRLPGLVPEQPLTMPRRFRNSYEAAKAEAEAFVLASMEGGLPATIHRPSMVVGDSHSGRVIHFQVFYHLAEFLTGRRSFGVIPDAGEFQLDIVPVDYVARAIHAAARREDATGRIFHLCSGPSLAPRLTELAQGIRRHVRSHGQRLPRLRPVPRPWITGALPLATRLAPPRARRALESLPFFLAYLEEPQLFDSRRTGEFFSREGLQVPAVGQYLDVVLAYYWARRGQRSGPSPARDTTRILDRG